MSLSGTLDQNSLSGSMARSQRQQLNLFQKLQILSQQLQGVSGKLTIMGEECHNIMDEKEQVQKYLERKSEENRLRLMGQLDQFQSQIKRRIENTRAETQKIDQHIGQMKQAQLYTLQMILALQRRVQQLEVQLGLEEQD